MGRVGVLGVAIVAMCGVIAFTLHDASSAPSSTGAGNVARQVRQVENVRASCSVFLYDHDARVTFRGLAGVDGFCRDWERNQAGDGTYWTESGSATTGLSRVCVLSYGLATATVLDDGQQDFGQQACETLLADGWTEAG